MMGRFALLNLKRQSKRLPAFLFVALLLGFFVYFLIKSVFMQEGGIKEAVNLKIALVTNDSKSDFIDQALNYLLSDKELANLVSITATKAEKAEEMLENGEVIAIITLPKGVVNDILIGQDTRVNVRFAKDTPFSSLLMREVTEVARRLLVSAQATTYAMTDLYMENDKYIQLPVAYTELDIRNYSYALDRKKLFHRLSVDAKSPDLLLDESKQSPYPNAVYFYLSSALLFLFFFSSVAFSPALARESKSFLNMRLRSPGHALTYAVGKFIPLTLLFFGILSLLYIPALQTKRIPPSSTGYLTLLLFACSVASLSVSIHMLFSASHNAVLVYLVFCAGSIFISGCILPSAFLPKALDTFSSLLPFKELHRLLMLLLKGEKAAPELTPILWIILPLMAGSMILYQTNRRENLDQ